MNLYFQKDLKNYINKSVSVASCVESCKVVVFTQLDTNVAFDTNHTNKDNSLTVILIAIQVVHTINPAATK